MDRDLRRLLRRAVNHYLTAHCCLMHNIRPLLAKFEFLDHDFEIDPVDQVAPKSAQRALEKCQAELTSIERLLGKADTPAAKEADAARNGLRALASGAVSEMRAGVGALESDIASAMAQHEKHRQEEHRQRKEAARVTVATVRAMRSESEAMWRKSSDRK